MIEESKYHLALSKTTYFPHLIHSSMNGFYLIWLGITSIIHAVVPAWFNGTAPMAVIRIFFEQLKDHPQPAFRELIREYEKKWQ